MAAPLDLKNLEQAFQGRADLQGAIKSAASKYSYLWSYYPTSFRILLKNDLLGCLQLTRQYRLRPCIQ